MQTNSPLGYNAALNTVKVGRAAFFGAAEFDLPVAESEEIKIDDKTPQFGYVGSRYSTRRILLLGINPGNGPRGIRNAGDREQMPHLQRFKANPTPENFARAQNAHRRSCEGWFIWGRECNEILSIINLALDDVAFSNALPWRTASEAAFSKRVGMAASTLYVQPLLQELKPKLIVAVGKKVLGMLPQELGVQVVPWNRARALTGAVRAEREAAATLLRKLVPA